LQQAQPGFAVQAVVRAGQRLHVAVQKMHVIPDTQEVPTMAYANDIHAADAPSLLSRFTASFGSIMTSVMEASQANRCLIEAERLGAMTDTRLAELGLTRDQVVTHAFRRYLYL
jgi:acetyl-CoA carboxylase carboxyltransferase component